MSTCPNRSVADPFLAILTNDDVEPVAVEGVRWIPDTRYYYEEYDGLGSEDEDTDDGGEDEDE